MNIMFLRSKRVRLTIDDHGHLSEVTEFGRNDGSPTRISLIVPLA